MDYEDSTPDPSVEVLLRAAQHRVRNDLQTIFSLIRLSERRLGKHALQTEDILRWLNAFAAVYDALPIWDQHRTVAVRQLVLAGRERIPVGDVLVTEDSGAEVPGASGVAMTLAVTGLLSYARSHSDPQSTLSLRILSPDGDIRVECLYEPDGDEPESWPPFNVRIPVEALGGRCQLSYQDEFEVASLVVPCR